MLFSESYRLSHIGVFLFISLHLLALDGMWQGAPKSEYVHQALRSLQPVLPFLGLTP